MMLDSKTIETLSVNAVKDSIVMSEFLEQFIAENDKEPLINAKCVSYVIRKVIGEQIREA